MNILLTNKISWSRVAKSTMTCRPISIRNGLRKRSQIKNLVVKRNFHKLGYVFCDSKIPKDEDNSIIEGNEDNSVDPKLGNDPKLNGSDPKNSKKNSEPKKNSESKKSVESKKVKSEEPKDQETNQNTELENENQDSFKIDDIQENPTENTTGNSPFRKSKGKKFNILDHMKEISNDLLPLKLEDVLPHVKSFRNNIVSSLLGLTIIDPNNYGFESEKLFPHDPAIERILDINAFLHLKECPSKVISGERGYASVFNRIGFTIKGPANSQNYIFSLALKLAKKHNAKLIDFDADFFNKTFNWCTDNKSLNKPVEEYYHGLLGRLNSEPLTDPFVFIENLATTILNDPNEKYIILLRNHDPDKIGSSVSVFRWIWDIKSPTLFLNTVVENKQSDEQDSEETIMIQFPSDQTKYIAPVGKLKNVMIPGAPSALHKKGSETNNSDLFGLEAIDITQRFLQQMDHKSFQTFLSQVDKDMNLFDNSRSLRACLKILGIKLVDTELNEISDKLDTVEGLSDYLKSKPFDKNELMLIVKNAIKISAMETFILTKPNIEETFEPYQEEREELNSLLFEDHINNIKEYCERPIESKSPTPLRVEFLLEAFSLLNSNFEGATERKSKKDIEETLTPTERKVYENYVNPEKIETTFDDIGSLTQAKDELLALLVPLRLKAFQKNKLIKSPTGILLYGPPGTGKTMLAKALARSAGASFIHISASSILSKWLGESEDNTAAIFTLARKLSPTIIFIDEVDGLLQSRDMGEHESSRRVKNEFFSGWDGLFSNNSDSGQVTVICATNRPFDLDSAALRRLPHRVLVPLPDKAARKEIFAKTLKHSVISKEWVEGQDPIVSEEERDEVLEILAEKTERYSGSDIKSVCVRAALQLVRDFMADSEKINTDDNDVLEQLASKHAGRPITLKEFQIALDEIMPSVDPKSKTQLELNKWHQVYGHNEEKKKISTLGF